MSIIKRRYIWFAISGALLALSALVVTSYGFNLSIDFKGGSITEVRYTRERPEKATVESEIAELGLGGFSIRPSGEDTFIIRTQIINSLEIEELAEHASVHQEFPLVVERANTIGPTAGAELQSKAMKAIVVVILMIVLFITFAFRKVSKPVSSFKYGLATIISLAHDVVIPTGVFVLLGYFAGVEMDLLFVTGLLAILGYSVHDTIVVFDRVRENLRINQEKNITEEFEITVGRALRETMSRSINTGITIVFMSVALYVVGPAATKDFSLLFLIGLLVGTYSSIFIASPLLVTFYKLQKKSN